MGEEHSNQLNIHIYPNPSTGLLTIEFEQESSSLNWNQLEIYNSLGELVLSQTISGVREYVDLRGKTGIYFFIAKSDNGEMSTPKRIVIE